jgi:zinc transport system permease protein
MMAGATLYSLLFSTGGLAVAWIFDAPAGAMAVVLAGIVFLGAAALSMFTRSAKRRERVIPPGEKP